jgi:hypothetical protein
MYLKIFILILQISDSSLEQKAILNFEKFKINNEFLKSKSIHFNKKTTEQRPDIGLLHSILNNIDHQY